MGEARDIIEGLPDICGREDQVERAAAQGRKRPVFPAKGVDAGNLRAAAACALHMHQPLIPAGGGDLRTASVISNLKHMFDNQGIGDNHNAGVFQWCYKRMGEFVPKLVGEGKEPRIMLEYTGTLLYGLRMMGAHDVLDALAHITCDERLRDRVEWLGCPWGHPVAPSTPAQDYRLHVTAWRHHFAALFGAEALGRVRGFSPSEMALPNHPDTAYEFVKTLLECGYTWVLVQEHTVADEDTGHTPRRRHVPHRLACVNSKGEKAEIAVLVKTQGSDTKLVAQMQPWYEAKGLSRVELGGKRIPPLVIQIADGENGGVMMNEFPDKYHEVVRESSGSDVPLLNGTEYLEHLEALGLRLADFPAVIPIHQKAIWERMKPGDGPDRLKAVIEECKKADHRFHMEGGSWTNNMSWVQGYENVLGPMEKASSVFHEKVLARKLPHGEPRFRRALFHLLCSQTSCYRYWGQGVWTDYGRELCRRAQEIVEKEY